MSTPPFGRVMAMTTRDGECLVFTGTRTPDGYGRVSIENKGKAYAHRVTWEEHNGPIPDGLVVRHSCDNPPCVNIEHLLIGTHKDNAKDRDERRRGAQSGATHCKYGHPFDEENTRFSRAGRRICRTCNRRQKREARRVQGNQAQVAQGE